MLLQLPVCTPTGSSEVGYTQQVFQALSALQCNDHRCVGPVFCTVRSTISSVTLVTWCWDSSSSSLSLRETSSTNEPWFATNWMRWWDTQVLFFIHDLCSDFSVTAFKCPFSFSPLQECGIPKHFGVYYAMGTALMTEGLLSACYHVCPNYTNFQFGETWSFFFHSQQLGSV